MIYREITLKKLNDILLDSVVTSSIVLLLVGCSMGMSWAMTNADVPELINELITRVSDNKWVILFIINIILLIVGTFMDITPAILIFTPIFLPIAQHLGIDPIHFGIIMVFNLTIGLCTPPVGTILFVGCSIGKVSIDRAIKPLLPMFLALFVVMAIICYFPQLSLMLRIIFDLIHNEDCILSNFQCPTTLWGIELVHYGTGLTNSCPIEPRSAISSV